MKYKLNLLRHTPNLDFVTRLTKLCARLKNGAHTKHAYQVSQSSRPGNAPTE
jgi:hypothetical protein